MVNVRLDMKTAAAVNKGLAAALLVNVPSGVKVMSDEGVPTDVIARIFLAAPKLRASDWKHQ